jgi:hypothetical protein
MNPNPWSYKYIRALADEATVRSEQQGLQPAPVTRVLATWKNSRRFNIPFLGDYVPEGWEKVEEVEPLFVDCTGRARAGEFHAITQFEFFKRVEEWVEKDLPYALGVIERGQTQVLVAVYRRVK